MSEVGTQKDRLSTLLVMRVQAVRELRQANPVSEFLTCDGEGKQVPKQLISHCQEKPLVRSKVPVPQTDTGR